MTRQIVAICLVRNEERFLDQVLRNILPFCDRILVADHQSGDRTFEIAQARAARDARIECRRIAHPRESHDMIAPYINTPTWIFAVDGDEIYDPERLAAFRAELLAGRYDTYWRIIGNALNCTGLDLTAGTADGYLSPPSRSIVKLFYFGAITAWTDVKLERLHDGRIDFRSGYADSTRCPLHERFSWEDSPLRCLHMCFLPRSGTDRTTAHGQAVRWNLADRYTRGPWIRLAAALMERAGIRAPSRWKAERYARGPLVTKSVASFLAPAHEALGVVPHV